MNLSDAKKKFVFTTRIELDDNDFIELRELNQSEIKDIGNDDPIQNLEALAKLFPACVVDSSFTRDDGSKATGKEIYEVLKDSGSVMSEILTTWIKSIPFQSRLKKGTK